MSTQATRSARVRLIALAWLFSLLFQQTAWPGDFILHIGQRDIHAEIADTPETRSRGLMHRAQLCQDCGMLFIFEHPFKHAFWMKDTPLPLSIAFIAADGSIINIEEMQPYTTTTHNAQGNALYALEMNSGWFAGNGIRARDKVQGLEKLGGTDQ